MSLTEEEALEVLSHRQKERGPVLGADRSAGSAPANFSRTLNQMLQEAEGELAEIDRDHGLHSEGWFVKEKEVVPVEDLDAGTGSSMLFIGTTHHYTMMMQHAMRGCVQEVAALLDRNAEVNHQDATGDTALTWAAMGGHLSVCELLIKREAEVNTIAQDHCSALLRAAAGGHAEVCRVLIKANATIEATDIHDRTPLRLAVANGHCEAVATLVECSAELSHTPGQQSVLGLAAQLGFAQVAKTLMDEGADPNEISTIQGIRWSDLLQATQHAHHSTMKALLAYGADPDERSGDALATPTTLAARHGDLSALRLLLGSSADPNKPDGAGYLPLMRAVQGGHHSCVVLLLRFKATPELSKPPLGKTALSLALELEDQELQAKLLQLMTDSSRGYNIPDLDLSLIQLGDNEDAMLTLSVTREAIVARKFSRMVKYAIQVQREQLVREMRHAMRFIVADYKFKGGEINKNLRLDHLVK